LVFGPVTEVTAEGEHELPRTKELYEGPIGSLELRTSPELIQYEGVEAEVARMRSEDADPGGEQWEDLPRRGRAKTKVVSSRFGPIDPFRPLGN